MWSIAGMRNVLCIQGAEQEGRGVLRQYTWTSKPFTVFLFHITPYPTVHAMQPAHVTKLLPGAEYVFEKPTVAQPTSYWRRV
jgi:hypothetical protein